MEIAWNVIQYPYMTHKNKQTFMKSSTHGIKLSADMKT